MAANPLDTSLINGETHATFCPTEVVLLPTTDCNLRCIYCYSRAGDQRLTMPLHIAQRSIDFIADNAKRLCTSTIRLGFHGGGEPFMLWPLMVESVRYARRKAAETGRGLRTSAFTNGLLSEIELKWAVENLNFVTISLDGPAYIQDHYRPTPSGTGSFDLVSRTCKYFDRVGMDYEIRVTVTAETVDTLPNTVEFLLRSFECRNIRVEPLSMLGRSLDQTEAHPPNVSRFVESFTAAKALVQGKRVSIQYSGLDMASRDGTFCGAAGKNFIVSWEGGVTSCYIASGSNDPRLRELQFGMFDPDTDRFLFDYSKLRRLAGRRWHALSECQSCVAGPWCAGDCLARAALEKDLFHPYDTLRCRINAQLIKKFKLCSTNDSRPVDHLESHLKYSSES